MTWEAFTEPHDPFDLAVCGPAAWSSLSVRERCTQGGGAGCTQGGVLGHAMVDLAMYLGLGSWTLDPGLRNPGSDLSNPGILEPWI